MNPNQQPGQPFPVAPERAPRLQFAGVQRDRGGSEAAFLFTDALYGSTICVPVNDPYSMYERLENSRRQFRIA